MRVGTRELKNRLSYYLRQVRDGEPVYVTDRGQLIAEIRPAGKAKSKKRKTEDEILDEMAARGEITRGKGRLRLRPLIKMTPGKTLSEMIIEDRG